MWLDAQAVLDGGGVHAQAIVRNLDLRPEQPLYSLLRNDFWCVFHGGTARRAESTASCLVDEEEIQTRKPGSELWLELWFCVLVASLRMM